MYVCVCVCVCQGDNRESDGAGAGAEVLLFRGGGQSELTQKRTAGHLQGTQYDPLQQQLPGFFN